MTNLPRKISIGGFDYKVRPLTPTEREMYYGLCTRDGRKNIALRTDWQGPEAADTALHEVLHALMYERHITYLMKHAEDPEELIVAHLATGLIEVVRRNPQFVRWLLENATC